MATDASGSTGGSSSSSLRKAIQQHSQTVNLGQLARRKKVARVVSIKTLEKIMMDAIESVLLQGAIDPLLERDKLRQQTSEEFHKLLASHQKGGDEGADSSQEREALQTQVAALQRELQSQTRMLELEKTRSASAVHLSEDSLTQVEQRVRKLVSHVVDNDGSPATRGPASVTEQRIVEVLESTLREERDKVRSHQEELRGSEVQRMERRIRKLQEALQTSELQLATLASANLEDPGVASIYRSVQGLAQNDPQANKKSQLIQVVFVNNLRLRNRKVTAEDLEGIPEELLLTVPSTAEGESSIDGDGLGNKAASTQASKPEASEPEAATEQSPTLQFQTPVEPVTDETAF